MKDFRVPTSLRWCHEAQRAIYRCLLLRGIISQMLEELPANRRDFFKGELCGVDTRIRALYDGRKLQKPHNETNTTLGESTSSRPAGQSTQ